MTDLCGPMLPDRDAAELVTSSDTRGGSTHSFKDSQLEKGWSLLLRTYLDTVSASSLSNSMSVCHTSGENLHSTYTSYRLICKARMASQSKLAIAFLHGFEAESVEER